MKNSAETKDTAEWSRTTVLIREEFMEKLKILTWWEKTTIKDLFDEMIENYLSSKKHLDFLINERKKSLENKAVKKEVYKSND